ncbi:MAG TPA: DNA polymerase III subunit beta [Fimbriimonadaceae bacterium]|nr:DNA polymerase III subunit beta [Fimbriimonadaceae bacterium]HRJ32642.1 DNA polymerase III subunit beta [Fimbriimonadaceae bacterium]
MKLEVSRKDLFDAVMFAGSASTSHRTSLPLLQCLRLKAEGSQLTLLGCDGELWAERTILAAVEEPGEICVSAQLMMQLVSALPDGQATLELIGTSLDLRQGMSEWKMMALPADDYYEIPELNDHSDLTLPAGTLRSAIQKVSFAVADDLARPVLTGVLFTYNGEKLTMVATDTHRLAVTTIDQEGIGASVTAIVPEKALRILKGLSSADNDPITIKFDDSRLRVEHGNSKLVSMLLSGSYPNWERVVPAEHTRSWILDKAELMDNVKRAMILAKDTSNRIRFTGSGDQVVISVRSEDKGEAKEEVAIVNKNGDIEIAFNGRYVLEALGAMPGAGVRAEMTEPSRPAVFRPVDESDQFCVIMPMAIS